MSGVNCACVASDPWNFRSMGVIGISMGGKHIHGEGTRVTEPYIHLVVVILHG